MKNTEDKDDAATAQVAEVADDDGNDGADDNDDADDDEDEDDDDNVYCDDDDGDKGVAEKSYDGDGKEYVSCSFFSRNSGGIEKAEKMSLVFDEKRLHYL